MSRRSARKNAFFLLFQMDFNEAAEFEQVKEIFFAEKEEPVEEGDKAFILSEVEGVVSGSHGKGFTEFFGKKGHTKCVKVVKDENDAVVDMEIIVKFGVKVQKVATEVQEKVKSTVETMTGLNVAVVNVSVSGVVKEAKAEEEE